jgi:hypothetical protein
MNLWGRRNGRRAHQSAPARRKALVGLAVFATALVLPAAASASAVLDGFSRTGTVDRWDVADGSGGAYSYVNDGTNKFVQAATFTGDCANPCAYMAAPTAGSYRQANLTESIDNSTTLRDVNVWLDFELSSMPTAGSVKFSVVTRTGGTNGIDGFLGSVSITPSGAVTYGATKSIGTGPTVTDIGTWASNGTTFTADTWWHLHLEVYSTSLTSTHLRMRVWKTTQQSTWPFDLPNSTPTELQTTGYVAVRSTRGSGVTNAPNFFFDNLQVDNSDTPPTAPADPGVSGGSATWTNGSRTITASAATAGSLGHSGGAVSIDHYEHRTLTGGSVSAISSGNSVTISTPGTTFAQFRAVDAYGNASSWYPIVADPAAEARIDSAAPAPPAVVGGLPTAVVGPVTVSAYGGSDAGDSSRLSVDGNGLPAYQYRTSTDNGSTWSSAATATDGQVTISATGTTLVQFRTVDNAGNTSSWAGPSSYAGGSTDDASNHVTINSGGSTGTDACSYFKDSLNRTGHITSAYEGGDGLVHLTAAASPYIVTCLLSDDTGAPLYIEPGTVLEFGSSGSFSINSTVTIGSATDARPVLFESTVRGGGSTGHPGDWLGVTVTDPSNNSTVTNARFSDGGGSTGTVPTFQAYNTGDITVDKSVFSGNKTDISSSTKPGVVEILTVGPDTTPSTLTVTHSQIVDNVGNGAKSADATLTINHFDEIERNHGDGVFLTASGNLSSFNPGTVNNSDIVGNHMNGIHVFLGGSGSGGMYVTPSSGTHNNLAENGDDATDCSTGNGCDPGEIRVDVPNPLNSSLSSFDFTGNYLGQAPYEYMCLTDSGLPGNVPLDGFYVQPYQMLNGLYMELTDMIDQIEARATGDSAIGKAILQKLLKKIHVTPGALGINDWTALAFRGGGPDDIEVTSADGTKHCFYDQIPTAPATFTEFDNSGQ